MPNAWRMNKSIILPKSGKFQSMTDNNSVTMDINNYRPITISSILCRIHHRIVLSILRQNVDVPDSQFAFSNFSTSLCIKAVQLLRNYAVRHQQRQYMAFLDVRSAFDTLNQSCISSILKKRGCPEYIVSYILDSYRNSSTYFATAQGTTDNIPIRNGVKQGDPLSTFIFAICLSEATRELQPEQHGFLHKSVSISHLAYADDLVIVANTVRKLQAAIDHIVPRLASLGLSLSPAKCMTTGVNFVQGYKKLQTESVISINNFAVPASVDQKHIKYLSRTPFARNSMNSILNGLSNQIYLLHL
ncbi:hypothetical protein GJ496_009789 [Pomphorhynchus laevis]|nr:hypothetical protein GJ496_009789 [Pomphorhynchus laevis]